MPTELTADPIIGALDRLQRDTDTEKIAVVPGGVRFHHAEMLTGLYEPGRPSERITTVHLPSYAPDHNPVEHVWNTAKCHTATMQRETPEKTISASASCITCRTVDHDFEHLPPLKTEDDFVSWRPWASLLGIESSPRGFLDYLAWRIPGRHGGLNGGNV